jgi:L-alanine-DL-glutamate epimerase-like enolase superfamily enzyme
MQRRTFLRAALGAATSAGLSRAALPKMKITGVRFYVNAASRAMFNQSSHIVTIETDQGLTGIGEGGSKDTVEQAGAMLIGEDPSRIDRLWQMLFRAYFYPAGREKLHAIGALDMALWDLKAKALGVPLYELLGGLSRQHVECYSTGFPGQANLKETARACVEAGFRAFRTSVADTRDGVFNSRRAVDRTFQNCQQIREGVGPDRDWAIDYHTRLDLPDAVRLSSLIEPLAPYFCEDPLRSENPGVYRELRRQVRVPIAAGEQFGARWDVSELIENHLIDYARVSIPNVGGITEFMKIAALAETHYVGLIPHFTGSVAEAALVHCCGVFSGPVLMEMTGAGPRKEPHLPQSFDFKDGKLWPNQRPGLGVEVDFSRLRLASDIRQRYSPTPLFHRPDGSYTNWD